MNILHLSDIHFGRDRSVSEDPFGRKSEILDKLIDTLVSLDDGMKPDLVLVTGDIAWTGRITEFDEAYEWFQRLQTALGLDAGRFVFCPGNHDLNRNTAIHFREEELRSEVNGKQKLDIDICDELYEYKNAHKLETRFHNYNVFCEKMGMQPYSYKNNDATTEYSYLVGSSELSFGNERYLISCFNTAYLPYGKVLNDDQMFLGLPQIQAMIGSGLLSDPEVYRIALFHHADRYLHPNEQCEYNGRQASLPLLMRHVDLALCGHTETGGVPLLRTFGNGGSLLSGGAAYYNDDHPNSFSLLRLVKGSMPDICSFYFNGDRWTRFSAGPESKWEHTDASIVWKDYIHNHPRFTFAVQVNDHCRKLYSGYFTTRAIGIAPDKIMVLYDNYINPSRAINVFSDQNGPVGQLCQLGFGSAPGMRNTTEARIILAEYDDFISTHLSETCSAQCGLIDMNGKWVYEVKLPVSELTKKYRNHVSNARWYKMVQTMEDYFEVIFQLPELSAPSKEVQNAVSWLHEIMDYGDLHLKYPEIIESWFFAHKKEELQAALQTIQNNGMIGFHFERKLKFCLFGTEIDFKDCDIYCIGAQPRNRNDIIQKVNTWKAGDRRTAEMIFPKGLDLWICPRYLPKAENVDPTSGVVTFHMPPQADIPFPETMKPFIIEY